MEYHLKHSCESIEPKATMAVTTRHLATLTSTKGRK
jgi:hypothetical protein